MNNQIIITNIQRLCLHDGPGIRTTIFLKGCSIQCPWCANPETISKNIQYYIDKRICFKKNDDICKYNNLCNFDNIENTNCPLNAIKTYGYKITEEQLFDEIMKDIDFFDENGGVTFSGGEPLLQIKKYENLLRKLKQKKINIIFETALFVPIELVKIATNYTNDFIVDIKILDKNQCKNILNGNIDVYLANLKLLFDNKKNVIFRLPMSNEYTLTRENIELLLDLLENYKPLKIEIFKLHSLASKKYENLNIKQKKFSEIDDNLINELVVKISNLDIKVDILKV